MLAGLIPSLEGDIVPTMNRAISPLKERVWARYDGVCWACGLTVNTKHGRLEPIADEPKVDKMREENLAPMHQDCALLKPKTATWKLANQWRARTRGSAGARVKATRYLLREILDHGCDPEFVRDLLQTTDEEQQEWWAYCDAQAVLRGDHAGG